MPEIAPNSMIGGSGRARRLALAASFVLWASCWCGGIMAQAGGDTNFSSPEAIGERLRAVEAELADAATEADPEVRELLEELKSLLLQHRESVDYLAGMQQEAETQQAALRGWKGLERKPPYPVRFVDELRARHESLHGQLQAAHSRLRIIERAIEDSTLSLEEHQRAVRRYAEEAETTDSVEARRASHAAGQREELAARIEAESLARLRLRRDAHQAQVQALESALELAALPLGAVRGQTRFTRAELNEILLDLERRRSELLAASGGASAVPGRPAPQQAWKLEIIDLERRFWNQLFRARDPGEAAGQAEAIAAIEDMGKRIDEWVQLMRLLTRESVLVGDDERTIGATPSPADVHQVLALQSRIRFALEGLRGEGARGPSVLDRFVDALLAVWNAELYLAEEIESVGGNRVTTVRAEIMH